MPAAPDWCTTSGFPRERGEGGLLEFISNFYFYQKKMRSKDSNRDYAPIIHEEKNDMDIMECAGAS